MHVFFIVIKLFPTSYPVDKSAFTQGHHSHQDGNVQIKQEKKPCYNVTKLPGALSVGVEYS